MAGVKIHLCAMGYCMTRIPVPRVFCSRHWSVVPDPLKNEIADAWIENDVEGLSALLAQAKNAIRAAERTNRGDY